jgi:hypothetical protein
MDTHLNEHRHGIAGVGSKSEMGLRDKLRNRNKKKKRRKQGFSHEICHTNSFFGRFKKKFSVEALSLCFHDKGHSGTGS